MVGPGSKLGRDGPRSKIADRMLSSQLRIRERWIDSDEFVYEMYMVAGDGKEFIQVPLDRVRLSRDLTACGRVARVL